MKFDFIKNYKYIDVSNFFSECARRYGEEVQSGYRPKNPLFDAVVTSFINTVSWGDYGFYSKDIYSDQYRNPQHFDIIHPLDTRSICGAAKYKYLWQIQLSNKSYNSPQKATLANQHMHEDISYINFSNRDVLDHIDNFLMLCAYYKDTALSKDELLGIELSFENELKQNNEKQQFCL